MVSYLCSSGEIEESQPEIAMWGIGAVEQHGPHLPVGTDLIQVASITYQVALELGGFLIPPLPFSMSECHGKEAGTQWLRPDTLGNVVKDVVSSLVRGGINKIVVVNGHGGNFVLSSVVREMGLKESNLDILLLEAAELMPSELVQDSGIHAGAAETSLQLYLNKNNVKDRIGGTVPPVGREFLDYLTLPQLSPKGIWGDPEQGSAELGREMFERAVKKCISKVKRELNYS
ncbi:creatininase family protein [Candidatus Bipolaricaulota bacterium]|nr:creatininase family protein [Candidatus Bipolaricaulota bacterium]